MSSDAHAGIFFVIFYCQSVRIAYNEKYKPKIYLIVVPHELFVRDFFICGKEMHYVRFIRRKLNDCWCYFDCGWCRYDWLGIGVMVLATGIIFVM